MLDAKRLAQPTIDDYKVALDSLLASASLDAGVEGRFSLDLFDNYEWQMRPGCDADRFNALKSTLESNDGDKDALDEFMSMVSDSGQVDTYFQIYRSRQLLSGNNPEPKYPDTKCPWGEMDENHQLTLIHRLMTSLTPEQCDHLCGYRERRETEGYFEPHELFGILDALTGVTLDEPGQMV